MANWKITNKVAFITVDNASSNNVAISLVALVLLAQRSSAMEMNRKLSCLMRCPNHHPCCEGWPKDYFTGDQQDLGQCALHQEHPFL